MEHGVQSFLMDYFSNPMKYWADNTRQPKKFVAGIAKVAKQLNLSEDDAMREIISVARARNHLAGPTLYMSNIGSSGSHWLQRILSSVLPMMPCGETYVPPKMLQAAKSFTASEKRTIMQAILLSNYARSSGINAGCYAAPAINTAHIGSGSHYSQYDAPSVRVLLVRNPMDIVISRTFRKQEYRDYLFPEGIADQDYVDINLRQVERFYSRVRNEVHDFTIKYENLVAGHDPAVAELCRRYKPDVTDASVDELLAAEKSKRAPKASPTGQGAFGAYKEPVSEELVAYCEKQLASILEEYGYSARTTA